MFKLRSKDKNKDKRAVATSTSAVSEPRPTSSHTFTKNFELQTLSLKEALKNQLQMTKVKREELRDLNNRFDSEVSNRRKAEERVNDLQNKLSILQSKVKGLELQYEVELNEDIIEPGNQPKTRPDMSTIRKIHQFAVPEAPDTTEIPKRKINLDLNLNKLAVNNLAPPVVARSHVPSLSSPQKPGHKPKPKFRGLVSPKQRTRAVTEGTPGPTSPTSPKTPSGMSKPPFGLNIPMKKPDNA